MRSHIEHVFAEQKDRMNLFIRTIGIAQASIKIGLANLVYNIKRFIWLERECGGTRLSKPSERVNRDVRLLRQLTLGRQARIICRIKTKRGY